MKVRNTLITITAVLLIVTTTALGIFLGIQLDSTADEMYGTYLSELSKGQAENLGNYLAELTSRLKTIAALPEVQDYTSGKTSERKDDVEKLLNALTDTDTVTSAVIYDSEGKILIGSGINETETLADGVCDVNAKDYTPVINEVASRDNKSHYSICVRAAVNNYNIGLVFDQEDCGVRTILKQSGGTAFIVDPNGSIINTQTLAGNMQSATQQYSPYKEAVENASTTPAKYIMDDSIAYVTANADGWVVVASNQISNAHSYSISARGNIVGIGVLLVIIFLVAGILLIISVMRPLNKIEETLVKIHRGDHDARIDIIAKNEYGDIARVFNDIMDNIIVSETRYRTIIEMSDNIIFEWNFVNNEVVFSNNFNKKFSYRAPSDHFADSFLLKCKVHPDDAERYRVDLEKLAKGENFKHNEYRWKNIYGDYIWVLIRTATINDKEGNPIKCVGVIVDIDRAKKSENMLTARASFDSLTGVYNRETIESAINNEIELIAARKNQFAILFVDIDDFKFFNDNYSHATGDQVLRFTATTIKNAIGDNGMAGRYGGDEFIICLRNSDQNDPAKFAEQILNTLKDGFDSDSGDHLTVNVSIGISIIHDASKRVDEIIGMADDAMYKIKKNGKSNYGFLD